SVGGCGAKFKPGEGNLYLNAYLQARFLESYPKGVDWAVIETNLPETTFPAECPWTFKQAMDDNFLPEARNKPGVIYLKHGIIENRILGFSLIDGPADATGYFFANPGYGHQLFK